MSKETKFIKPFLCSLSTEELLAIYARKDVDFLHCGGKGVDSVMRRLAPKIDEGRLGGTLVFCRLNIGRDSNTTISDVRRLLLPFSDMSETHWMLFEKAGKYLEVEYVFKKETLTK